MYNPLHDRDEPTASVARVVGNRTAKMVQLIASIESGQFPSRPSVERCSTCPYGFICPA
jgi:hypothetical protein